MIELTEEQAKRICERYCRYPWMVIQQAVLDIICGGCPLAEGDKNDHEGDGN
jgi:hypothetical protein